MFELLSDKLLSSVDYSEKQSVPHRYDPVHLKRKGQVTTCSTILWIWACTLVDVDVQMNFSNHAKIVANRSVNPVTHLLEVCETSWTLLFTGFIETLGLYELANESFGTNRIYQHTKYDMRTVGGQCVLLNETSERENWQRIKVLIYQITALFDSQKLPRGFTSQYCDEVTSRRDWENGELVVARLFQTHRELKPCKIFGHVLDRAVLRIIQDLYGNFY